MGRRKNAASDAAAPTPDPVELPLASSVAISECLIAVVEYVVIASMQGTLIRASHLGNGPVGNAAAVCAGVTLLAWMLYRQATTYDVSIARLLHMMGLYRVPSLTKAALVLVGLQAVSHCALYGLHRQFGSDIVSVKHLLDASGSVRWNLVVDLVIVAPIREEIVFRGILQLIVHRRLPDNCRAAVFMPSFFFSVIHALNFNAGRYSFSYVCMQIAVSFLIASFYSMRVLATGSVWEPLLLHSFNNLLACSVDQSPTMEALADPLLLLPLLQTVIVYAALIGGGWRRVPAHLSRFTADIAKAEPSHVIIR
ncbi:Abortive infection protein [Plasmodiophora brassicae]